MTKKTISIQEIIHWWENELSWDERTELLPQSWSEVGDVKARHQKLRELYNQK